MAHANYILRPTYTPLPSKKADEATKALASDEEHESVVDGTNEAAGDTSDAPGTSADAPRSAARQATPHAAAASSPSAPSVLRAANEDDDLYDPYSDYHDGTLRDPHFERDPWS